MSEPLTTETTMAGVWIYRKTEHGLWTVGFYDPQGKWHSESDHDAPGDAANHVNWLNGGNGHD